MDKLALLEIMSWSCENEPALQVKFADWYEENKEHYQSLGVIYQYKMQEMLEDFKKEIE